MNLKYKYRLYPTQDQENKLRQIAGGTRYVWNKFLSDEMDQYKTDKTFRFFNKNSKDLTALKDTFEWLNDIPSTSVQQTLRDLDKALKQSFGKNKKTKKGFPKFKKRKNFESSFTLVMVNSKRNLKHGKFYCPKVGLIRFFQHRSMPSDFKSLQVKQEAGKWFVVFTCQRQEKPTDALDVLKSIGIDLNSKEYVCSDGTCHSIPKYLRENQTKIKRLQRAVSRKTKGSNNRRKAQLKLAKLHHRIKCKRLDYFHKLTKSLVDNYDIISLEDLDVKGIQQKYGSLIADNGFSIFRQMIQYKAELYGKETVIINRWYPSSQTCSSCDHIQKMPLNQRTYKCGNCGYEIDRDLNSAININRVGLIQSACGNALVDEQACFARLAGIVEAGSPCL
jgi:putative transposase